MNEYKIIVKFFDGRIDIKTFNTVDAANKFFDWAFEKPKVKSVTFCNSFGGEWSKIKTNSQN